MSWDGLVIVADEDLGRFEPECVDPSTPWGKASWPTEIEQAKRILRVWVDTDYAALGVGASDRLRDRYALAEAKTEIGGTFADIQTEASDDTEEDVALATIFATPGSDFIYCGAKHAYSGLFVHLLDSVNANSSTLTVSYWALNQWQAVLSQADGTSVSAATFAQSGRVTWTRLPNWERRSLDGSDEGIYWTRLSVSASLTAGAAASSIVALRHPEGLRTVAAFLTLGIVMRGLSIQSGDPEEWRTRADAYMDDAKQLYDRLKLAGGIPLDTDESGAVDPLEQGPTAALRIGRMPRA